jgi:mono/diheme cytochrome c family protein
MAIPVLSFALACATVALVAMPANAQTPSRQPTSPALQSLVGRDSFNGFCASCHGTTARGDGPLGPSLKTKPSDLTTLAERNGKVFPRQEIVSFIDGTGRALPAHGAGEMPIWGPIFRSLDSDARTKFRLNNLVAYIESLQTVAAPPAPVAELNGGELFRNFCAGCHGAAGRGDGAFGGQLLRDPPNLTTYRMRNRGSFPGDRLRRIIDGRDIAAHGTRAMPVWGAVFMRGENGSADLVARRIQALVDYIQSIQERPA